MYIRASGDEGSLLEKQGWCQSCRLSAQAQGDLGALTRLLDGPTGQHRPIGHCTAARQPQDAEGGLYMHLADRRQHRPQRRVAGVMLSRSAAALGLLHVDWFDHDVDGQLWLVGEAAAARTGRFEKRHVHG